MMKSLAYALIGTSLLAAPALAAENAAPKTTTTTTSTTSASTNFLAKEQSGQWRSSKLVGMKVYNNNGDKIGDIADLLVDAQGKTQAAVISVGGFLGMGEHNVAVPFTEMKWTNEVPGKMAKTDTTNQKSTGPDTTATTASNQTKSEASPTYAIFNATKEQLKAAPNFQYAR